MGFLVVVMLLYLGDGRTTIPTYRLVGDRTLVLNAQTGATLWARVTSVVETDTSVTVNVSSVGLPGPQTGTSLSELTVELKQPLGSREVIDGSYGGPIRRVTDAPASGSAPGLLTAADGGD